MKKHEYDLVSLIKTFEEHAKEVDSKTDFNLPKALLTICVHIQAIYDHIRVIQKGDYDL